MIKGVDTTFLVQLEIKESQFHNTVSRYLEDSVLNPGHVLGIAPQVLMEFIRIVTDEKRFEKYLTMKVALEKADFW